MDHIMPFSPTSEYEFDTFTIFFWKENSIRWTIVWDPEIKLGSDILRVYKNGSIYNFTIDNSTIDNSTIDNSTLRMYITNNVDVNIYRLSGDVITILQLTVIVEELNKYIAPLNTGSICFLGSERLLTNQGKVKFNKLTTQNTINGYKIKKITKVYNSDNNIIFIRKHALGNKIPDKNTFMGQNHGIYLDYQFIKNHNLEYQEHPYFKIIKGKKIVRGRNLIKLKNITRIFRQYDLLYNVLLDKSSAGSMIVNGILCETLNPNDPIVTKFI